MSRVSFNRKRVKLKKLIGIRARLALLALMLVAPLMLERARSFEPDKTSIREALGRAYFHARRYAEAREEFAAVVERSPVEPGLGVRVLWRRHSSHFHPARPATTFQFNKIDVLRRRSTQETF